MSSHSGTVSAEEALFRLQKGNEKYMDASVGTGDISPAVRRATYENGQHPYVIIVTCPDSRVIPESIFQAGIGELFVIRVAGNVIDDHQLGSIEYAAEHLGCSLVVVLGHTCCGAVNAAINGGAEGFIRSITQEIETAIGGEKDDYKACCLNVRHSMKRIRESLRIAGGVTERGHALEVAGAVYYIEDGRVEFLE